MPVKMIKPKPLRLKQITAIIDQGLKAANELVKADFALATGTWEAETSPEWKYTGPMTKSGDRIIKTVTKSKPFVYVDQGTAGPYLIPKVPKKKGSLAFQRGFIPKTRPGRLVAGVGAKFGPMTFSKQVTHPGIKARNIAGNVAKRMEKDLPRQMEISFAKGREF